MNLMKTIYEKRISASKKRVEKYRYWTKQELLEQKILKQKLEVMKQKFISS